MVVEYPAQFAPLMIEKGSICLDGISLTVFGLADNQFTVAIIPYTWQHTAISTLKAGQAVNLEFDLIGKYLLRGQQLKESLL